MINFKVGDKVKHCGNPRISKRVGWTGKITCVRGHSMDVVWEFDKNGEKLPFEKVQGYSEQWIGWYLRRCEANQETQEFNTEVNMNKFYVVVSEQLRTNSMYSPTVSHPTKEEAETEALRLANKHGVKFYIMETVSCAVPPEKPVAILMKV